MIGITQSDIITLGDLRIEVHEHPGHTEGSSSYTFNVSEQGRDYVVGVINMGTINSGKRLVIEPTYENVASDFASTYNAQKKLPIDIWVSAHNGQYDMHSKYQIERPIHRRLSMIRRAMRAIERLETAYLGVISDELDE